VKKIVGLSIVAVLIIGMVGGGTWAYFNDTETSAGNTLSAGTLDLIIDEEGSELFSVSNVAPGDNGTGQITLANIGSLAGELDVSISTVTNTPGAGGTEYEGGSGELGANAQLALYIDLTGNGITADDIGLASNGTTYDPSGTLNYDAIDNYALASWDAATSIAAGADVEFVALWDIPTSAGNDIQGDSVSFDVIFLLEQSIAD
jgi:spore coat-associated protein N